MKSATSAQRPYQEVGAMIRDLIIKTPYNPGERLPPGVKSQKCSM